MCDDIGATVAELEGKGVEFTTPVENQGFGLITRFKMPGAGEMGLYQPRHPRPTASGVTAGVWPVAWHATIAE